MGMELKQSLKMSQQLVMTPQLQQAIKLLQLSRMELLEQVREEMEQNPLLEQPDETVEGDMSDKEPARLRSKPPTPRRPSARRTRSPRPPSRPLLCFGNGAALGPLVQAIDQTFAEIEQFRVQVVGIFWCKCVDFEHCQAAIGISICSHHGAEVAVEILERTVAQRARKFA